MNDDVFGSVWKQDGKRSPVGAFVITTGFGVAPLVAYIFTSHSNVCLAVIVACAVAYFLWLVHGATDKTSRKVFLGRTALLFVTATAAVMSFFFPVALIVGRIQESGGREWITFALAVGILMGANCTLVAGAELRSRLDQCTPEEIDSAATFETPRATLEAVPTDVQRQSGTRTWIFTIEVVLAALVGMLTVLGMWTWIPQRVVQIFGQGQFTATLAVDAQGCAIAHSLGNPVAPSSENVCRLSDVRVESRIGRDMFVQFDTDSGRQHIALAREHILAVITPVDTSNARAASSQTTQRVPRGQH